MEPTAAEVARWAWGSVRGLRKAQRFSGLSIPDLRGLVAAGELVPLLVGERQDQVFAKRDLARVLARRLRAQREGQ